MKILEANAGALTNYEVVDFLRSKGAANDSTRVLAQVSPSEYKVYDYLVQTAACNQTREHINDFVDKCKIYGLAKAEVLNIINIRPTSIIDIYTIIEEGETRFGDETRFGEVSKELAELVEKTLPPPPTDPESEAGINEGKEETENEEHNVETKGEEQTKEGNDDGKEETVVGELMDTS
ncbi:uncharacterized protein LOC112012384 isoform X1 [Quercus suber]|uniref:DNA-directed RNA polymerase III subunit RPC9 n=1 Tax=Quercus suber TaxID=58331 RepID=A0AAW0IV69_QUESU|nr:uncharacterized protein LOC112012384 [Quercus suber]POE50565.1 dna-directed rna polymerase iii subunit rpc9 [Quercus suber]